MLVTHPNLWERVILDVWEGKNDEKRLRFWCVARIGWISLDFVLRYYYHMIVDLRSLYVESFSRGGNGRRSDSLMMVGVVRVIWYYPYSNLSLSTLFFTVGRLSVSILLHTPLYVPYHTDVI